MRKILLFLLVILSFQAFGQTPPGYQTRIVRERIQGSFMVDSALHIPRYNGTPIGVRVGSSVQDGAIAMDTVNHLLYIYSGGVWRLSSGGFFNPNQTSTGNTSHDANYNQFDVYHLKYWQSIAGTNPYSLIYQDSTTVQLYAQKPGQIRNYIEILPDSLKFYPFMGQINIDSLRTQYGDTTTWKPLVWSPSNKGLKKFNSWGEIGFASTLQQVTTAGQETTDYIGVEELRIWPTFSGSRYTSNWVGNLGYSGNGVSAYGNLTFRENSTGGGNTVTLSPVNSIPSSFEIFLPPGNSGDTLATLADVRAGGGGSGGLDSNISNANLTQSASHTYDLNGFTQTFTNGTFLNDSLKFTNTVIYPTSDSLIAYGDSYTNPGSNASVPDSIYIYRLKNLLGQALDNQATSGRGAWLATANSNLAEFPGHTKMSTFLAGLNDVRRGGGDARTYNKVINSLQNIFINHFLKSYQSAGNGANVTRYGTWTTTYPASTIGGKSVSLGAFTSVLNDSIVYSFTNDNVVATVIFGDGTTEVYSNSIEIYLDGVLQTTYTSIYGTDAISDGSDGNTRQPGGFIFTGLTYGTHSLKLVNKQNAKVMIIDYFGHLVPLNGAYPFIIFHAPKLDATGYATAPANASNTIIQNLNDKIDSLAATFPSGYPVYVAPTNSFFTNTTASGDLDVADHIHPTDQGHRHIYDAAVSVYGSFPTNSGLNTRLFWSGGRPWAYDSTNHPRPLAYAGEAASVAGSNKQFQYNNAGQFGGASGVEYGNTNNLVKIESPAVGNMMLLTKGFASQTAPHYQAQSSAGTPLFNVEADGGVQVLGLVNNPIGSGSIEMEYRSGVGTITSYNRGGSSWQELRQRGSNFSFQISGSTKASLNSSGYFRVGDATSATSTLESAGSFSAGYVAKTGTYPATANDYTIECTANTFTVTLPTAVGITGRIYNIVNSGAGIITIATTSSQTFVNVVATPTTLTLSAVGTYQVQSNGANWLVLSTN